MITQIANHQHIECPHHTSFAFDLFRLREEGPGGDDDGASGLSDLMGTQGSQSSTGLASGRAPR